MVSYNNATTDFSTATPPWWNSPCRSRWCSNNSRHRNCSCSARAPIVAFGGGGFLGYNTQWQDLVLGVEANYTHTYLNTTATSSYQIARASISARNTPRGNVTPRPHESYRLWRGAVRAGYIIGNLMPYGFIGMVVGRAATAYRLLWIWFAVHWNDPCSAPTRRDMSNLSLQPRRAKQRIALGLFRRRRTGLGADAEHIRSRRIRFRPVRTGIKHKLGSISGRLGAGYKF